MVRLDAGRLTCLQVGAIEGGISEWGEVVTRYACGNVGMDHLLSMEKVTFPKLVNVIVQINKLRSSKNILKNGVKKLKLCEIKFKSV